MTIKELDFLSLESELSEQELMIRDTTRKFVMNRVLPDIQEHFSNGTFPPGLIRELGDQGFLGVFIPEQYGGAGGTYTMYGLVCQEMEYGDSGIRSVVSVQSSLVMFPIFKFGSEEQRKKYLPKLASGELVGCFGLTEPDYGSDPGGMITKAIADGDTYVLNGTKRWITNADIADVSIVWAKTENGEISAFLVEKGTKGLEQREIKHKFSLRASHTGELILEDCRIPKANRLAHTEGLKSALQCLDSARFGIVWGALGAATSCYHCALEYAGDRKIFDKPLSGFQLAQSKLVWMLSEITKGQLLALRLGRLRDAGTHHHTQTSLGKMNNCHIALEVARQSRDILGANGITVEYPVIRHMLNLESVKTYEGTDDVHRLILGRHITGQSAFE
jgi:glutaryl-CoA dehydrogenase